MEEEKKTKTVVTKITKNGWEGEVTTDKKTWHVIVSSLTKLWK